MSRFVAKLSPISPLVSLDVGGSFQSGAIDVEDNSNLNLGEGVEYFTDRVLFVAGNARHTSALTGNRSIWCSSRTDLVVIPDAG